MKTISYTVLKIIEETKHRFYEEHGKNCEDEKRLFVNWYVANHSAPINVLVHDLSEYYLFLSEDTILSYLK